MKIKKNNFNTSKAPVILFDGVCSFCNSAVQFIIKRDSKQQFQFASLQSEIGRELLKNHRLPCDLSSMVLVKDGKAYTKSTAALHITRDLSGGWSWLYGFIVLPPRFRDGVYNWIAQHRYKIMGKESNACRLPSMAQRKRFLT